MNPSPSWISITGSKISFVCEHNLASLGTNPVISILVWKRFFVKLGKTLGLMTCLNLCSLDRASAFFVEKWKVDFLLHFNLSTEGEISVSPCICLVLLLGYFLKWSFAKTLDHLHIFICIYLCKVKRICSNLLTMYLESIVGSIKKIFWITSTLTNIKLFVYYFSKLYETSLLISYCLTNNRTVFTYNSLYSLTWN